MECVFQRGNEYRFNKQALHSSSHIFFVAFHFPFSSGCKENEEGKIERQEHFAV